MFGRVKIDSGKHPNLISSLGSLIINFSEESFCKSMNRGKINLNQRSPVGWLFLSLIPFVYFYWLASSHKQVNQLNGDGQDADQIKMSPWWPIGLFLVGTFLVIIAIVIAVFAIVSANDEVQSSVSLPVTSTSTATVDDPYFDPYPTTIVVDESQQSFDEYNAEAVDDATTGSALFVVIYTIASFVLLAFSIVHFFYLLQLTDGLVGLAGSDKDKTALIVMSAIACFVFGVLLLAVVYKAQLVINQAIDKLDQPSA